MTSACHSSRINFNFHLFHVRIEDDVYEHSNFSAHEPTKNVQVFKACTKLEMFSKICLFLYTCYVKIQSRQTTLSVMSHNI